MKTYRITATYKDGTKVSTFYGKAYLVEAESAAEAVTRAAADLGDLHDSYLATEENEVALIPSVPFALNADVLRSMIEIQEDKADWEAVTLLFPNGVYACHGLSYKKGDAFIIQKTSINTCIVTLVPIHNGVVRNWSVVARSRDADPALHQHVCRTSEVIKTIKQVILPDLPRIHVAFEKDDYEKQAKRLKEESRRQTFNDFLSGFEVRLLLSAPKAQIVNDNSVAENGLFFLRSRREHNFFRPVYRLVRLSTSDTGAKIQTCLGQVSVELVSGQPCVEMAFSGDGAVTVMNVALMQALESQA